MCGCMLIVAGLSTHNADIRDVQADVGLLHVLMSGKSIWKKSEHEKGRKSRLSEQMTCSTIWIYVVGTSILICLGTSAP